MNNSTPRKITLCCVFWVALMEGYLLLRTYSICMWYSSWTTVVTKRLNNSSIWSSPAARLTATTKQSYTFLEKEEILTVFINWTSTIVAAAAVYLSRYLYAISSKGKNRIMATQTTNRHCQRGPPYAHSIGFCKFSLN